MKGASLVPVLAPLIAAGGLAGCAARTTPQPSSVVAQPPPPASTASVEVSSLSSEAEPAAEKGDTPAYDVPREIDADPHERRRVAVGLNNPRGVLPREDGSLLVAVAGTGDPEAPDTGALLRLSDDNEDGDFGDEGERTPLLDEQPSKNILGIVQRDEVFGMADVAEGGGTVLATLAFFGGPSTVFRVEGDEVSPWATIHGNLNDIAYHEGRDQWFAVSSSSDEVLRIGSDDRGDRIVKLPPMDQGQDPVPGYIRVEPATGSLLVSLFSGSTKGEAGGDGTDIVSRAGTIVSVDPESGQVTPVITGLTAPTDFYVLPDGTLYVLEFCDAFVEPINDRKQLFGKARHGGFRRFSGRLLAIDPKAGRTTVVAEGLDAPTNLARRGDDLLITQGMGTPGRPIPGPDGKPTKLDGFIDAITVFDSAPEPAADAEPAANDSAP